MVRFHRHSICKIISLISYTQWGFLYFSSKFCFALNNLNITNRFQNRRIFFSKNEALCTEEFWIEYFMIHFIWFIILQCFVFCTFVSLLLFYLRVPKDEKLFDSTRLDAMASFIHEFCFNWIILGSMQNKMDWTPDRLKYLIGTIFMRSVSSIRSDLGALK